MRILPLALLLFSFVYSSAQKIALPKDLASDSSILAAEMPRIAKEAAKWIRNENRLAYFESLLSCQLVAKEYPAAIVSLDSISAINSLWKWEGAAARNIQYRSFALCKLAQANDSRPFEQLYEENLAKLYSALPEGSKLYVSSAFDRSVLTLQSDLNQLLAQTKSKDSISAGEALALVRQYNNWSVYDKVLNTARHYLLSDEKKKFDIRDSVLITMKDGGKVSAIIVRNRSIPAAQPAILMYNIYAEFNGDKILAEVAAGKGYVGIIVNTRGKKLSPDSIEPFEHDAQDAYEIIDWISRQPWCNGNVGMYGGSYLGFSQWSAVKKVHPALKTIVPQVAVGIGIDYPMHNNIFMIYMLPWIHYVTNNKFTDPREFSNYGKWIELGDSWYKSGKSFRSFDTLEGRPNTIFQRWLDHPSYDSYWQRMVPYGKEFSHIKIPILTTTGYYDDDQRGAFYYFEQHHKWDPQANHYLLIGPYNHGAAQSAAINSWGGYTIDPAANISINKVVFEWFDHVLKGGALPSMLKDKINYQVMGTNMWRSAPSISAISKDTLSFYLDNTLSKKGYKLVNKRPSQAGYIAQEIDYLDRTEPESDVEPAHEPDIVYSTLQSGGKLVFASEPLEKNTIMTGSFQGTIALTINKKDIDLAIDLYELQPDGKYFLLSQYRGRASYAKDREHRNLLRPGYEENIPVRNSYFVSKQLQKGSRIVVVLGMNNNSRWQVNYGTGRDVSSETIKDGAVPLQIKWSNKSCIKLPVEQ